MTERRLSWEGCLNVRDLGGHPTEDGGATGFGAVVRADSIRHLTDAGWDALVAYGVGTIVDLRLHREREADPPHPPSVEVVHVPLGGGAGPEDVTAIESAWGLGADAAAGVRNAYFELLERYRPDFAQAVAAVGEAGEGGVLVHCYAGKDRTGLVSALILRLVGVALEDIAADYALSEENLASWLGGWIAEAPDDEERERRRRMASSPPRAMLEVLAEVERRYGSIRDYLLAGGAAEHNLERARARLLR